VITRDSQLGFWQAWIPAPNGGDAHHPVRAAGPARRARGGGEPQLTSAEEIFWNPWPTVTILSIMLDMIPIGRAR
jgi:hypothetical protein